MAGVKQKIGGVVRTTVGVAGKSAYQRAVELGFSGTEQQWMSSLLGSIDNCGDVDTTTNAPSVGQLLRWNGSNWVPYTPPAPAPFQRPNVVPTGASYTAALTDKATFIAMTSSSAQSLVIPPVSSVSWSVGDVIEGAQMGAGQVTLTPGSGVSIVGSPGLKIAAQYGVFSLRMMAGDSWLAFGRLA